MASTELKQSQNLSVKCVNVFSQNINCDLSSRHAFSHNTTTPAIHTICETPQQLSGLENFPRV